MWDDLQAGSTASGSIGASAFLIPINWSTRYFKCPSVDNATLLKLLLLLYGQAVTCAEGSIARLFKSELQ